MGIEYFYLCRAIQWKCSYVLEFWFQIFFKIDGIFLRILAQNWLIPYSYWFSGSTFSTASQLKFSYVCLFRLPRDEIFMCKLSCYESLDLKWLSSYQMVVSEVNLYFDVQCDYCGHANTWMNQCLFIRLVYLMSCNAC